MGVEEGSGDVNTASKAGDKGGNREVTSKPLPFVNGPPEGCVWEQGGDLGVGEGMWEAEEGVSEIEVPKVVRLRQCLLFWREVINALSVIEHGYVLPLLAEPTPRICRSHHSAYANAEFVRNTVTELLDSGCIAQVEATPHISSPLSRTRKG